MTATSLWTLGKFALLLFVLGTFESVSTSTSTGMPSTITETPTSSTDSSTTNGTNATGNPTWDTNCTSTSTRTSTGESPSSSITEPSSLPSTESVCNNSTESSPNVSTSTAMPPETPTSSTNSSTTNGTNGTGNPTCDTNCTSASTRTSTGESPSSSITGLSSPPGKDWHWWMLIAGVPAAGGVLLLVLVVVVIVCCRKRMRRKSPDAETGSIVRTKGPRGDPYTHVKVPGRDAEKVELQALDKEPSERKSNGYVSLSILDNDQADTTKTEGRKSAVPDSTDYDTISDDHLEVQDKEGTQTETSESDKAHHSDPSDVDYVNHPAAKELLEADYKNCSEHNRENETARKNSANEGGKKTSEPEAETTTSVKGHGECSDLPTQGCKVEKLANAAAKPVEVIWIGQKSSRRAGNTPAGEVVTRPKTDNSERANAQKASSEDNTTDGSPDVNCGSRTDSDIYENSEAIRAQNGKSVEETQPSTLDGQIVELGKSREEEGNNFKSIVEAQPRVKASPTDDEPPTDGDVMTQKAQTKDAETADNDMPNFVTQTSLEKVPECGNSVGVDATDGDIAHSSEASRPESDIYVNSAWNLDTDDEATETAPAASVGNDVMIETSAKDTPEEDHMVDNELYESSRGLAQKMDLSTQEAAADSLKAEPDSDDFMVDNELYVSSRDLASGEAEQDEDFLEDNILYESSHDILKKVNPMVDIL